VYCLRVDQDGGIEVLDEADSGGKGPNHLALWTDHSALLIAHVSVVLHSRLVLTAVSAAGRYTPEQQYNQQGHGSMTCLPLDPDTGRFLTDRAQDSQTFHPVYTPSPSNHPRLEAAHVHQVIVRDNEVIACDLGSNKVWRLRMGGPEDRSRWVVEGTVESGLIDGDGPRHVVIHPNGEPSLRILDFRKRGDADQEVNFYISLTRSQTTSRSTPSLLSAHQTHPSSSHGILTSRQTI
jgi:6-phosphogluconolactonase